MEEVTKKLEKAIVEQDWLTIATLIRKYRFSTQKLIDILSEVYLQGGQADQL
jgi:hypothetical protein